MFKILRLKNKYKNICRLHSIKKTCLYMKYLLTLTLRIIWKFKPKVSFLQTFAAIIYQLLKVGKLLCLFLIQDSYLSLGANISSVCLYLSHPREIISKRVKKGRPRGCGLRRSVPRCILWYAARFVLGGQKCDKCRSSLEPTATARCT